MPIYVSPETHRKTEIPYANPENSSSAALWYFPPSTNSACIRIEYNNTSTNVPRVNTAMASIVLFASVQ